MQMQSTLAKKCPCCLSNRIIFYKNPEPHLFCSICLHRFKNLVPARNYYKNLSGRSIMFEKSLEKKSIERQKFLGQYLKNGMQILELGCAEGALGEAIKRNFAVTYYGIEPSRDAKIARAKLDKVWESVNKISANVQFNLILAFHVLEHIHNIGNIMSKIYKLLSDNGIIVLEVPNYFGNKRLPWDFNKEHIHSFSLTSISCLLEKQGFHIKELSTGNYESAIYNDSMRIIASKRKSFQERKRSLVGRFRQYLGDRYIIYGAGGDLKALVLPYIKASNVLAVIDSSKNKIGKRIIDKVVQGPEAITKYLNQRFLIATYRYQGEILKIITKKGVDKSQIITLEDILEN
jgi:2-polyprenyl-3-methyl-5-hydroxy-6-metoxy-1,4-benzoquinol methylase